MLLERFENKTNSNTDTRFVEKRINRIEKQSNNYSRSTFVFLFGLIVLLGFQNVSTQESQTTDNKSDNNIKSSVRVNPFTRAMEFSIPLGSHPGRNGNSVPIGINYSSKVWNLERQRFESESYDSDIQTDGYGPLDSSYSYITLNANNIYPLFSRGAVSGWTSTLQPTSLINSRDQYDGFGSLIPLIDMELNVSSSIDYSNCTLIGIETSVPDSSCSSGYGHRSIYDCPGQISCEEPTQSFGGFNSSIGGGSTRCVSRGCHPDASGTPVPTPTPIPSPSPVEGPGPIPNPNPPIVRHEVNRFRVQMPNGSTHEFRKHDKEFDCTQYPEKCSGNSVDIAGTYLSVDGSGTRLERFETQSDDSIRDVLYLPDGGRYIFYPSSGVVFSGDIGSALPFEKFIDKNGNVTKFDGENNKWIDTMGREVSNPLPQVNPSFNASITVGPKDYVVNGINENGVQQTLTYKLDWQRLEDVFEDSETELHQMGFDKCTSDIDNPTTGSKKLFSELTEVVTSTRSQIGVTGSFFVVDKYRVCNPDEMYFNPVVLAEVILPNNQKYEFKYNEYGEITKITYPTGGYEKFEYGIVPTWGTNAQEVYTQANRGVIKRYVNHIGGENNDEQDIITTYTSEGIPNNPLADTTTIKAPDGSKTVTTFHKSRTSGFGFENPLAGRPQETITFDAGGNIRSRTLFKYTYEEAREFLDENGNPLLANPFVKRDARLEKTISITFEPNNAKALMTLSRTEFDSHTEDKFFAHLNPKRGESTRYVAEDSTWAATHYSTQESNTVLHNFKEDKTFDEFEAKFVNAQLASATETEYTYNTNYLNVGITGLPSASYVLNPTIPDKSDPNGVLAKTITLYDYGTSYGNVSITGGYSTDENHGVSGSMNCTVGTNTNECWKDQSNALKGRPTTNLLWDSDNGIWITSHTQYDIFGNGVKTRDYANREATVEFDSQNNYAYPVKTVSPAPGDGTNGTNEEFKTETTYDFMTGLVLETRDLREIGNSSDDLVSTMEYDAYLRPTAVVAPNGARTETEYDPNGLWVKSRSQFDTNVWNEAIAYSDGLGRAYKTRTIDSNGDVIVESKFDNMGRVTDVSNPYRDGTSASEILWTRTTYDVAGRVETVYSPVSDPDNNPGDSIGTSEYGVMNESGLVGVWTVSTDASGRKSRSITNSLGQLARVDEATGFGGDINTDLGSLSSPHQPTSYKYNIKGEMVEVTQGNQKRNFLYDSLGRLIRVKQPEQEINTSFNKNDPVTNNDTWTAAFKYDVMGKMIRTTDAEGRSIINEYDNADRVLKRCYSKKGINTTATTCAGLGTDIDPSTPTVTYKYDLIPNGKGALIETSNSVSTSKTTNIDQWGRPTEYQQITDGVTYTSSYQYNLSGALVSETYPSGRVVKNQFDSNGDLARIYGKANSSATERTYANSFAYTAHDKIQRLKLGNGLWEAGKFNDRLQVTELSLGNSASDTSLWSLSYDYNETLANGSTANTGNVTKQVVNFQGLTEPFEQTYKYDSFYRLTEAKEMAGTTENWKQNFTYDRYGNRQTHNKLIMSNPVAHDNKSHPTINQATNRFDAGQGYLYDKVGNITKDADDRNFTFDGNNKQTVITNNSGVKIGEYFYDGNGKRVKKKVYDANQNVTEETIFVYSLGKLTEEYSTATPPANPTTNYTITDKVGSPRVLADAEGNVKSRRDFMPFGEKIEGTVGERSNQSLKYTQIEDNVRQKFTGYERDDETGLDFAQARMYNNQHARFTAVDPLLASGKSLNPQTFNRYVYVMNSPLIYADPDGLQATDGSDEIIAYVYTAIDKAGNAIDDAYNNWFIGVSDGTTSKRNRTRGSRSNALSRVGQISRYRDYSTGSFDPTKPSPVTGRLNDVINPQTAPTIKAINRKMETVDSIMSNTPVVGAFYNSQKSAMLMDTGQGNSFDFAVSQGELGIEILTAPIGGVNTKRKAAQEGIQTLYHYTTKEGFEGIMKTKSLFPSTGVKNARFGDGQYFTDISPGDMTRGQVAFQLYGDARKKRSLEYVIEIDVSDLNLIEPRTHTFLNESTTNLDLNNRIIDGRKSVFIDIIK